MTDVVEDTVVADPAVTEDKNIGQKAVDFVAGYFDQLMDRPLDHLVTASIAGGVTRRITTSGFKKEMGEANYRKTVSKIAGGKIPLINA